MGNLSAVKVFVARGSLWLGCIVEIVTGMNRAKGIVSSFKTQNSKVHSCISSFCRLELLTKLCSNKSIPNYRASYSVRQVDAMSVP